MMFLKKDTTMIKLTKTAIQRHGFISLYDGLSAQLLRQITYTTIRFHLYDLGKRYVDEEDFLHKVCVASVSGMMAAVVGIPFELINTRMHVDRALKWKYRRNYRNVFDGLYRVWREEGFAALYTGGFSSFARATLVTIGQNAMYDQSKTIYMRYFKLGDDCKMLHLLSSLTAAIICAPLVQPIEIFKTMQMSKGSGHLDTTSEKLRFMMRFGFRGLFRGISPSLLRMIPYTIIMFLLYEQIRLKFGYYAENKLD
ncbi:mitochondrial dicarboxylate carrier [Drosophila montana]|uniref:mitochondrial dicarboxylate carrier n=1 Tax=Drosophila montana TaxID=40370 RepID=UPI00313C9FD2